MQPKTLLEMAGADLTPPPLAEAVLVLIDCQNEYVTGALPLEGVEAALERLAALLVRARAAGTPVVHIQHRGRAGGAFDLDRPRGAIHEAVAPLGGEIVIAKGLPNSFAGTSLHEELQKLGRDNLILTGFQTHMCVSATVRSALDHGYRSTVVADCCGTRALPDRKGGAVSAQVLHDATLAALADRFAVVVERGEELS
jgi:nicotinamidase-related amidase